tara:strand:+ start:9300 stop:9512 length:213 start_codon:yes stop_codon:yes gene_type:complete
MKVSKRQLQAIIKEEKTRLLSEDATGRALSDLYTAIDAMIAAMGNEGALMELTGIVEDWDNSFGMTEGEY